MSQSSVTTAVERTGGGPTATRRRVLSQVTRGLLLLVLAVLCLLLLATVAYPRVRGYVPLTILTGSMEPTYPVGSQVYVEPVRDAAQARSWVGVGSVITFMPRPDDPTLVTHRVVALSYDTEGAPLYTTQGDANDVADEGRVTPTQLRGVVRYHVPYIGYVASSVDGGTKGSMARVLAVGLFGYAAWNLLGSMRRRGRPGGPQDEGDPRRGGAGDGR